MSTQQIPIDLLKTDAIFCGTCQGEIFESVTYLRSLNQFVSPTGKTEVIPVPAFRCVHCKTVKEFNEPIQKKKII
jgi:hypothetical protein